MIEKRIGRLLFIVLLSVFIGTIICLSRPQSNFIHAQTVLPLPINEKKTVNISYGEEQIFALEIPDNYFYVVETAGNVITHIRVDVYSREMMIIESF